MPKIIKREKLVPNIYFIQVEAPRVAKKCKPGQFVIIMPDKYGERIPLNIADWEREKGTVSSVVLVVGTSTHKLSQLQEGNEVPVYVGPLGKPSEIKQFGTVLCVGGCYGIGAVYPVARALREAGNKVISLLDVKANYLLYWEDRFKEISDEFHVSARDSYYHCQEFVPKTLGKLIKEKKIDRVVAMGCTYLMYTCAQATRQKKIKTVVSLNPIMVDGTGMCGACRVTVDGKTKFACVDGPDFDGHLVDWEELFTRRKAYFEEEIQSLNYWEKENFP